jgi:hypothetical protein
MMQVDYTGDEERTARLDYGNFVMVGLPAYRQQLLQSVLNSDYVDMTISLTLWRCYTGCGPLSGLTTKWRSWHISHCTAHLLHTYRFFSVRLTFPTVVNSALPHLVVSKFQLIV